MVVVRFSNASHCLIAFTMNSSLLSEEIHDSCWSQGTRPRRSPTSSSVLLFGFPKSSQGLPMFITSAHTVINQGACLLLLCGQATHSPSASVRSLASTYLSTAPQSWQKVKDKNAMFKVFSWWGGIAAFLATLLPESGPRCQASQGKKSIGNQDLCLANNSSNTKWWKEGGKTLHQRQL